MTVNTNLRIISSVLEGMISSVQRQRKEKCAMYIVAIQNEIVGRNPSVAIYNEPGKAQEQCEQAATFAVVYLVNPDLTIQHIFENDKEMKEMSTDTKP